MSRTRSHTGRWLRLSLVLAALGQLAPAEAQYQNRAAPATARLPGFDIPTAPQDPQFPVLRGVFGEQADGQPDTVPPTATTQAPTLPTPVHPPARVVPPPETWDRAAERLIGAGAGTRSRDAFDASASNPLTILLIATIVVAATLSLVAILLKRGRLDRNPVSIVPAAPPESAVRRVDARQGAGAERRGTSSGTGRSPHRARRAAAASDSPTPPAG